MNRKWTAVAVAGAARAGRVLQRPSAPTPARRHAGVTPTTKSEFFDQAEFDRQLRFRIAKAVGLDSRTAASPGSRCSSRELVDTAKYAKPGGNYHLCFSNAAVNNPWRQVGFKTMQAGSEAAPGDHQVHRAGRARARTTSRSATSSRSSAQGCSALIVSPNTTATLTPAVEAACETGVPVIVFDRGVQDRAAR